MKIDKITTDDDIINFLLDQHKQTCNPNFMTAAHVIERYRRSNEILSWQLSQYEWISVDERLPEDNERVLCFSPSLIESNLGAVNVQFGWCCKRRNMDITHWMPLPKPPTESEN